MGLALISSKRHGDGAELRVKNHYEIDPNQEFIALGAATSARGILQGFAVSGADSRTAVNDPWA